MSIWFAAFPTFLPEGCDCRPYRRKRRRQLGPIMSGVRERHLRSRRVLCGTLWSKAYRCAQFSAFMASGFNSAISSCISTAWNGWSRAALCARRRRFRRGLSKGGRSAHRGVLRVGLPLECVVRWTGTILHQGSVRKSDRGHPCFERWRPVAGQPSRGPCFVGWWQHAGAP